jgi:hypothetical protein
MENTNKVVFANHTAALLGAVSVIILLCLLSIGGLALYRTRIAAYCDYYTEWGKAVVGNISELDTAVFQGFVDINREMFIFNWETCFERNQRIKNENK